MTIWRWSVYGVLLAAALTGCSNKDEMRWKEQVWLSDGRRIEVDRYSVALKSGFPNTTKGPTIYQEIVYMPLGVSWSTKGTMDMKSFDIFGNDAYLVVSAGEEAETFCVGKSKGAYLIRVYRWRKGKMQEIDQGEAPIARMGINLSGKGNWAFRDADRPKTYFSWDDIAYVTGQLSAGPPKLISDFYKKRSSYAVCN